MKTTTSRADPGLVAPPRRRAYRATDDAMLGGVAAGIARHLRIPVVWVRVGFLVAAVFGGFGGFVYAGLWMFLREEPHFHDSAPGLAAAERHGKRPRRTRRLVDYGPMVALGAIALGLLGLGTTLTGRDLVIWPAMLAVAGVAVLWRQADEAQRERWIDGGRISPLQALVGRGGWASYSRILAGIGLLVAAIVTFSLRSGDWGAALNIGVAAVLGILGLAFIAGPWLLRLTNDLSEERTERVRSQERADVAAHLHDSVLQTLAMIQKSAEDPAAVSRLARAQERDLRSWLYDAPTGGETTLVTALRQAAAEVEDGTGIPVEVVSVGDQPLPEAARALVLAAREAMLNAAKHSGATRVDVYAELTPDHIEVFVRDRGRGFDLDSVATDRHGVRNSIVDRMQRHGGVAEVRSTAASGTEIRLSMPLEESKT